MNEQAQVGLYQLEGDTRRSQVKQSEQQRRRREPVVLLDESVFGADDDWEENFEDDLIFLASNLEQQMSRLIEKNTQHQSSVTIRFLAEMVNHVVSFSEGLARNKMKPSTLLEALHDSAQVFPPLQLLQMADNRLVIETVVGVENEEAGWLSESSSSANQICQGVILILEYYFSFFETFFNSIDAQERWKEVCNIFVAELKQLVADDDFGDAEK